MHLQRRAFIAAAGAAALAPRHLIAQGAMTDSYAADGGDILVTPITHASLVLQQPGRVIHVDPVGEPALYAGQPAPDLILVTHEHGDHYNAETLAALATPETKIITNPAVLAMLPEALKAGASALANGESAAMGDLGIEALPAYNTTEERMNFHPQGRDNGYVLHLPGFTIYVSGDTEDVPEMRALSGIDLAFVCMNLPFTMSPEQAAAAVAAFAPKVVYPYHYRDRDGDLSNAETFAGLVGAGTEVKLAGWYG